MLLFFLLPQSEAAPIHIVTNGKSEFSIVVPQTAAHTVRAAAQEMQRSIEESTGAVLPIVPDNESVGGPFISLGTTTRAAAAGITTTGFPDDGYYIVTRGGNLYIIGIDTTAVDRRWRDGDLYHEGLDVELHPEIPGPAFTKDGGMSQGTANGVYTFLEDYLGVRWLMPEEIGRDVPQKHSLIIDEINRTEAPLFIYRKLSNLGRNPASLLWRSQMKLGFSFRLNHNHSWSDVVPRTMHSQHPEWFAMNRNGERPDPKGDKNYKLESTNPELIQFFAQKAIETLREHPKLNTFSLSPTDGLGYSLSPESQALFDTALSTEYNGAPSVTPLILKFYQEVSDAVAKEEPNAKLAGYFYQQYKYPPSQGSPRLPENFVPVLVASGGSYGLLYHPEKQRANHENLNAWGKIAPSHWFYYCYPTWMRTNTAMISPAAPAQLTSLFHDLYKNGIKGIYFYGTPDWNNAALKNYIAAKMLWNPMGDAVEIQREWLHRAYGPQAGAIMERLYDKLDESWFADYFRQNGASGSGVSEIFFRQIFGTHYPEMEKLVLEAEAQPMTSIQKERLELIINNMRVLQWRLRNAGYLPADYSSPYTIATHEVMGLNVLGFISKNGTPANRVKVDVTSAPLEPSSPSSIPNSQFVMLYPTQDGTARIRPENIQPGSNLLYYWVKKAGSGAILRGILDDSEEISFQVKAHEPYYLEVKYDGVSVNPIVNWQISIPNGIPAKASFKNGVQTLSGDPGNGGGWLYVYTPEGLNLTMARDEVGTLIQTLTSDEQKSKAAREARLAATRALEHTLKSHQGVLIQNLDMAWKFTTDPDKTGLEKGFAKAEFSDLAWSKIHTHGPWQMHGFKDYHGTGWYRKTFKVSSADFDLAQLNDRHLFLFVGAVDGDAVFYLNGEKIAERKQAEFSNSWQVPFAIDVTSSIIVGENTLAVEVTKETLASGLYKGVSLITGLPLQETPDP